MNGRKACAKYYSDLEANGLASSELVDQNSTHLHSIRKLDEVTELLKAAVKTLSSSSTTAEKSVGTTDNVLA